MIERVEVLYETPNALAPHYSRFRVDERLLLTGHSHQAWPDRAEVGQHRAFEDAARWVDEKWDRALEQAARVREGYGRLLDTPAETICLGTSTHELIVKWLSALPLRERPHILTTDSEFYSARRQLRRLEEEGIELSTVPSRPGIDVGHRLAERVDERLAAVLVSTVFFDSGEIAGGLRELATACQHHGVPLLLDVYHQLNVVPFSLRHQGLESAYVTGGGYKYCQLGEGNAFLRSPEDCRLRPVVTGWFAEFEERSHTDLRRVGYGPLTQRFAGATYDPTSHYRAAEVFAFFAEMHLEPARLRTVSQHQVARLRSRFDALDLPPDTIRRPEIELDRLGGFLALRSPRAEEYQAELARRGVLTDSRNQTLRFGPAPYLHDGQLDEAVETLGQVVEDLG